MKTTLVLVTMLLASTFILCGSAIAGEPIPAGDYECRESKEYKFKPCAVQNINDEFILTTTGSLFAFTAVLTEDDGYISMDASTTDERRFGCYSCSPECAADQANCGCNEVPPEASSECMKTPMIGVVRKAGAKWKGTLTARMYSVAYGDVEGAWLPVGVENELQSFEFTIRKAKKK